MKRVALLLCLFAAAALGQEHQNVAKGFAADKTYDFASLDHINLFNGSVNVVLPLTQTYTVSPTLSYRFLLSYGGNNWDYGTSIRQELDPDGTPREVYYTYAEPVGFWNSTANLSAGFGWRVSFGDMGPGPCRDCGGYRTADGAMHDFWARLHHNDTYPPPGSDVNVSYTNDGSYLRSRVVTVGGVQYMEVDEPNGNVRRFRMSDYRLVQIRDAFGNAVSLDWFDNMSTITCTISDTTGRSHTMTFQRVTATQTPGTAEPATYSVLTSISAASFNGAHATYTFNYDGGTAVRKISRNAADNQDCQFATGTYVPVLSSVTLPDNSSFAMAYDLGDHTWDAAKADGSSFSDSGLTPGTFTDPSCPRHGGFSGNLTKLTLPTGGSIEWTYRRWTFPSGSVQSCRSGTGEPGPCRLASLTHSVGVAKRFEKNAAGTLLSRRDYTNAFDHFLQQTNVTTVTTYTNLGAATPTVFSKTLNYYCTADNSGEYGLPYSKEASDPDTTTPKTNPDPLGGGRYLSTKTYDGSGHLVQYSYVAYEGDDSTMSGKDSSNRRVTSERVVYDDAKYAITTYSDFDGLGHYRTSTTDGNFAGANVRTSETYFNKPDADADPAAFDSGTYTPSNPDVGFTLPATTSPWILNRFSHEKVTEGGTTVESLACFDANGFLFRSRRMSGTSPAATDLVTDVIGTNGFVTEERSFGGDGATLGTAPLCTSTFTASTAAYRTQHTYSAGSLAKSEYLDSTGGSLGFYVADNDIDTNTGLVKVSRDPAGRAITYTYDSSGRLTTLQPEGLAATSYSYTNAVQSPFAPATVTETTTSSTTALGSISNIYQFDSFGRLWRTSRKMPDGTWSLRETLLNELGWKKSVSEAESLTGTPGGNLSFTPSHVTTFSGFDTSGRPSTITAPDGSSTTQTWTGVSSLERTVTISGVSSKTTEVYDRFGRLASVTEPSAGNVTTTYTYDAAGHLLSASTVSAGVSQNRTFSWDGRGLLTSETHPEKDNAVSYAYDARGHVTSSVDGPFTLTNSYDRAERLTSVSSGARTLKVFTYGTANLPAGCAGACTNWAKGKLSSATRMNWQPAFEVGPDDADPSTRHSVDVTETLEYGGPGGRVTKRTTTISSVPLFIGDTFVQSQTWNDLGQIAATNYPSRCTTPACTSFTDPATVAYGYTNGFLTSVGDYASQILYLPNGMLDTIVHTNGIDDIWVPDPNGMSRPCEIIFRGPGTTYGPDPTQPCGQRAEADNEYAVLRIVGPYTYDAAGNISAIGTTAYGYDPVSRLTSMSSVEMPSESFTYDAFGNMKTHYVGAAPKSSAPAVSAPTNRIVSALASYDGAGNITSLSNGATPPTVQTFTWDATGSMLSRQVSRQGAFSPCLGGNCNTLLNERYLYTGADERIARIDVIADFSFGSQDRTQWTLRDFDGRLLRTYSRGLTAGPTPGATTRDEDEIWRGTSLLASNSPTNGIRHYHLDHLGSPRMVTTGEGQYWGRMDFAPFGAGGVGDVKLQFTGHERDVVNTAESLDYMHARYYGAGVGRFLSVDPDQWYTKQNGTDDEKREFQINLRRPQGWNRYSYAYNNPIRYTDPDGKVVLVDDAAIGLFILGSIAVVATETYLQSPNANDPGHTNAQVMGMQIKSAVTGVISTITMAQNNRQTNKVVNGLVAAALTELGKVNSAGGPGKDPDFNHHKKEIKAMLDRAVELAKRLPKKAGAEIMERVREIGSGVGLTY